MGNAWDKHLQEHRSSRPQPASDSTPKKLLFWENRGHEVQKFVDDSMTTRIRQMEALTEVKELRLKVMELETQVQVATNQLRRQDEVGKLLKEELEASLAREKELTAKLREQQHKYSDLESKMKDEAMMARIRDAEHAQQVAELTQKISLLELKVLFFYLYNFSEYFNFFFIFECFNVNICVKILKLSMIFVFYRMKRCLQKVSLGII